MTLRRRRRGGVLFVTSNGVGLGHVSRLLAVARKLEPGTPAAFFTLSGAAGVIAEAGFPVDYMPSHLALKLRSEPWNDSLARRLDQAVSLFEPDLLVFDGSLPYRGLMALRQARGDLGWVWIRRAFWRADHDPLGIDREEAFDLLIEPGELAAAEDVGPTVERRRSAVSIPPILSAEPGTLATRADACARLGLRVGDVNVGLMLGSGFDNDLSGVRAVLTEAAAELGPGVRFCDLRSAIDDGAAHPGIDARSIYPVAPHLAAFDLVVSAAGYNSFHEIVLNGIPAIFVPNEAGMLDDQLLRARWAELAGHALCVTVDQPEELAAALRTALDPAFAAAVAARRPIMAADGAAAAARLIGEMLACLPARRPLAEALRRRLE